MQLEHATGTTARRAEGRVMVAPAINKTDKAVIVVEWSSNWEFHGHKVACYQEKVRSKDISTSTRTGLPMMGALTNA
jgi:hypothetical protein